MTTINRWLKREDIFSYEYILIPINLEDKDHWVLCVVDFGNYVIKLYDSIQNEEDYGIGPDILQFLRGEHLRKKGSELHTFLYRTEIVKDIPMQENAYDCGIFVLLYGLCVSRNKSMNFNQSHVPSWRKRILAEIVNNRLLNTSDPLVSDWPEETQHWN